MAGRGRGATLPSWMTQQQVDPALSGVPTLGHFPPPAYGAIPAYTAAPIIPVHQQTTYTPVPAPYVPPSKPAQPAQPAIDPVNDVKCWSEHYAEDKTPFWFNRVTKTSTYEKPACLKTAAERSLPTCAWKEFTSSDGKKYYSDGNNST